MKKYSAPELEINLFETEDILVLSSATEPLVVEADDGGIKWDETKPYDYE